MIHHLVQMIFQYPFHSALPTPEFLNDELLTNQQFALLGYLTSGIMHDIANPLTAATWSLESILMDEDKNLKYSTQLKERVLMSLECLNNIQSVVRASRQQLQSSGMLKDFSPAAEIRSLIQLLQMKIRQAKVEVLFRAEEKVTLYGDSSLFNQIISNLLTNAIDTYSEQEMLTPIDTSSSIKNQVKKKIVIELQKKPRQIRLKIQDWNHISLQKHNRLEFVIVKKIVEKDFRGKIEVKKKKDIGTQVALIFPRS